MKFSVIVPVYNRPHELQEFLASLANQQDAPDFETIVIEDGSSEKSDRVVTLFPSLGIVYHYKPNSGPGDSRNTGMRMATGDYFLIFDSDCILPAHYLKTVKSCLDKTRVDFFGGPDNATDSFSDVQKAINFTMTSFLTTGGFRGGSEKIDKFQPRSFNMGISRLAFERSGGFGDIHPGEDPDLAIRLWKMGFESRLFPDAFVYHKRRIDWEKFSIQVNKFGKARPILDSWHPQYRKIGYWFPTLFILGLSGAIVLAFCGIFWPIILYGLYFVAIFTAAALSQSNAVIGLLAVVSASIQFYGYGMGFLESFYKVRLKKMDPRTAFPSLFFAKPKLIVK